MAANDAAVSSGVCQPGRRPSSTMWLWLSTRPGSAVRPSRLTSWRQPGVPPPPLSWPTDDELAVADRHARDDAVGRVEQVDAPVRKRQLAAIGALAAILARACPHRRGHCRCRCLSFLPIAAPAPTATATATAARAAEPIHPFLILSPRASLTSSDASLFRAFVRRRGSVLRRPTQRMPSFVQADTRPSTCPPSALDPAFADRAIGEFTAPPRPKVSDEFRQ